MDKDIEFGLAVLRREYKERRIILVEEDMDSKRRDNILADLERILSCIVKVETKFERSK